MTEEQKTTIRTAKLMLAAKAAVVVLVLILLARHFWTRGGWPDKWTESEIRAVVRDEIQRAR